MTHQELRRLWGGFQSARVLITAVKLGVFDHMQEPVGAAAVARKAKADVRATGMLLDALAGLRVISKSGGKYLNADAARLYLVKGAKEYQGDIIRHADNLWHRWASLDEVVRTGKPVPRQRSKGGGQGGNSFDHEAFIMGMHNLSLMRVEEVLGAIGLKGVGRALDLGGGPGTYSLHMKRAGIDAVLFDYPETLKIARKVARRAGVKGIAFKSGDFHADDIGRGYDLILISQILHAYSAEDNRDLLTRCAGALNAGGRVAVQEFPLSEDRTMPPHSALFSINMLVGTVGGNCYTPSELDGWMREAGLVGVEVRELSETVLVTGRKG